MLLFITFLPQLIYFFLIMWVVMTVARVFMPKRGPVQRPQDSNKNRENQTNQNRSTAENSDVIDVEFTEREINE